MRISPRKKINESNGNVNLFYFTWLLKIFCWLGKKQSLCIPSPLNYLSLHHSFHPFQEMTKFKIMNIKMQKFYSIMKQRFISVKQFWFSHSLNPARISLLRSPGFFPIPRWFLETKFFENFNKNLVIKRSYSLFYYHDLRF